MIQNLCFAWQIGFGVYYNLKCKLRYGYFSANATQFSEQMPLKHLQQQIFLIAIYCKSVFRKELQKVNTYVVFILSLISFTYDQVYFTTRAPDANNTSVTLATQALHERH